jgi:hypothetical protein
VSGSACSRKGQCGQLKANTPTLRTRLERSDCVRRKVKPPGVLQQCRRFVGIEPKVGGPQLGELAPTPQPCHRQRRVATAADDEAQSRWQVIQEVGHPVVDRQRLDQVIVVEDKRECLRPDLELLGLELVGECGHNDLAPYDAGGSQKWKYVLGEAAARTVERADHVAPEPDRVVSCGSSESHATGHAVLAAQSAKRLVLPKPAGVHTMINFWAIPW